MPPGDVAFFDDNPGNVAAALALGMDARRTVGLDEVRAAVASLGP